jgi:Zn-dependent protease with chaperone function
MVSLKRSWWLAAALALLCGCSTNPITGRSQFVMVSEESAISGSASAYSNMMGQFSKKNKIEIETPRAERVRDITNRLVAEAVRFRPDAANWNWEVRVIDEPKVVNAFCMAGGKMAIYSGFWVKLNATDDEIANVMGHEIGHALASHTRERMSVAMATGITVSLLAIGTSSRNDSSAMGRNESLYGIAAALAVTLPNSRESESEADQIGIELAARAGYDPRAAVSLWKKMAAEGGGPPEFLSTHPAPENRMARLAELVSKVDPYYQKAKATRDTVQIPTFIGVAANERAVDGISREEYAAKIAAEGQVMTFVAEDFEKFRRGETVFTCGIDCAFGYNFQKGDWKRMHERQSWRDLAVSLLRVGYDNDLSYFLLAEAANGLGLKGAAKTYYERALAAHKAGKTCDGTFNTCEGFDIPKQAQATLLR